MSGRSRRKSWSRSTAYSPSRPTAQKRTVFAPCERRVQPSGAAANAASASMVCRRFTIESRARLLRRRRLAEPTAGENGTLQAATAVRIALHQMPDESAAVVLDHRHDRPLVDAEVVAVDPADVLDELTVTQRHVGEGEARVHRIEEAVLLIQVLAEAHAEGADRRDHDFRR